MTNSNLPFSNDNLGTSLLHLIVPQQRSFCPTYLQLRSVKFSKTQCVTISTGVYFWYTAE